MADPLSTGNTSTNKIMTGSTTVGDWNRHHPGWHPALVMLRFFLALLHLLLLTTHYDGLAQ